jgi:hypothetical protein
MEANWEGLQQCPRFCYSSAAGTSIIINNGASAFGLQQGSLLGAGRPWT